MSRIETGQTDISAHHLFILANEFGSDIADFFTDNAKLLTSGMRSVTRHGEARSFTLARYVAEVLSADLSHKDMHPAINHVTAQTLDEVGGLWSHAGEEFLYVLEGCSSCIRSSMSRSFSTPATVSTSRVRWTMPF